MEQLLNDKRLAQRLDVSRRKIWTMHAMGTLPAPMRIGERSCRWSESDIELWLQLGTPNRERFEQAKDRKERARNGTTE